MGFVVLLNNIKNKTQTEAKLNKNDLPYIIGMIALDIISPIFLMSGLIMSSPASVSLLVLGACVSWGFENNCTRMLSLKIRLRLLSLKVLAQELAP